MVDELSVSGDVWRSEEPLLHSPQIQARLAAVGCYQEASFPDGDTSLSPSRVSLADVLRTAQRTDLDRRCRQTVLVRRR